MLVYYITEKIMLLHYVLKLITFDKSINFNYSKFYRILKKSE